MAKVTGPLYSMSVSGAFGEIVFDRRGFIRRKGVYHDAKTAPQGNYRQAMTAAQRCAQLCGPQTRQHLQAVAEKPGRWSPYLTKFLLGAKRSRFRTNLERFHSNHIDRAAWEAAATGLGLVEICYDYANEAPISPGAQLFLLAGALFELGIYTELGNPAGEGAVAGAVAGWQERIVS